MYDSNNRLQKEVEISQTASVCKTLSSCKHKTTLKMCG